MDLQPVLIWLGPLAVSIGTLVVSLRSSKEKATQSYAEMLEARLTIAEKDFEECKQMRIAFQLERDAWVSERLVLMTHIIQLQSNMK